MRKFIPALFIVFLLGAFNTQALSQTTIELNQSLTGAERGATSAHYHYFFENPRFTTPVQELEFDGSGQGKFRFSARTPTRSSINSRYPRGALADSTDPRRHEFSGER